VGARFSAPVQIGLGPHPASYTMGAGSFFFAQAKRPGRGVNHPPLSSAEVKERVELYLCFASGPLWSVLGYTFFTSVVNHYLRAGFGPQDAC
jgi:hypothetical protein